MENFGVMMRLLPPLAGLFLAASPASATELFGGAYDHAIRSPLSLEADKEGGLDLSIGVRGKGVAGTRLQPYALVLASTNGQTSFVAAGLSARFDFARQFYIRPGLGLAVHDGSSDRFNEPDRIAFGSRLLFAPELGVGVALNDRLSVEASLVHFSHATLLSGQNPGIDNLGVRLNWRL